MSVAVDGECVDFVVGDAEFLEVEFVEVDFGDLERVVLGDDEMERLDERVQAVAGDLAREVQSEVLQTEIRLELAVVEVELAAQEVGLLEYVAICCYAQKYLKVKSWLSL